MSDQLLRDLTVAIACGVTAGIMMASAIKVLVSHFSLWADGRIELWLTERRERRNQQEQYRRLLEDVDRIRAEARKRETT